MTRARDFISRLVLLACVSCGQSTKDPAEPVVPLAPGTCVNTDCTLPMVESFQPAPSQSCELTEGAPIVIEWSQPASEVDCAGGKCVAFPVDVAVGPGEETWTSAHLVPKVQGEAHATGLELLRNDPLGALQLERETHVLQPLTEQTVSAMGMNVDAKGELDWVGPSPSSSGVSLLHFDRDGERLSTRWMIQRAEQSFAHFGPHGITVSYGYIREVDMSVDPPVVKHAGSISRFDAEGHIVWNQTALAGAIGVASDGSVFVVGSTGEPEEPEPNLLARLAPDGHVLWVRSMSLGWPAATMNVVNDTFVFSTLIDDVPVVETVDLDGNGLWTTRVSVYTLPYAMTATDSGRVLFFGGAIAPEEGFWVVSPDGTSCTHHPFPAEVMHEFGAISDPAYAQLPGERHAFAFTNLRGVLKVP